jgi:hypothetical protein
MTIQLYDVKAQKTILIECDIVVIRAEGVYWQNNRKQTNGIVPHDAERQVIITKD